MATPYGIDYLKNLVGSSLGSNQPKGDDEGDDSATEGGANGPSSYGMPSGMIGGGGMSAAPAGSPYGNTGPMDSGAGGNMLDNYMQAKQMGPNFQAIAGGGSIGSAAGPVARGAVQGLDTVLPGAQAALQGVASKASGGRGHFEDAGPPQNMQEYLARLAHYESAGNPLAYNKSSGASGLHQYLDSTWNNYGGYKSAKDAPASVQFQRAMEDTIDRLKHNNGDIVKATLTHFLGAKGLAQKLANPQKMYEPVNAVNGATTPFSYGAGVLGKQVMQDWMNKLHTSVGTNSGAQTMPYNLPANGMASPPLAQASQG